MVWYHSFIFSSSVAIDIEKTSNTEHIFENKASCQIAAAVAADTVEAEAAVVAATVIATIVVVGVVVVEAAEAVAEVVAVVAVVEATLVVAAAVLVIITPADPRQCCSLARVGPRRATVRMVKTVALRTS